MVINICDIFSLVNWDDREGINSPPKCYENYLKLKTSGQSVAVEKILSKYKRSSWKYSCHWPLPKSFPIGKKLSLGKKWEFSYPVASKSPLKHTTPSSLSPWWCLPLFITLRRNLYLCLSESLSLLSIHKYINPVFLLLIYCVLMSRPQPFQLKMVGKSCLPNQNEGSNE